MKLISLFFLSTFLFSCGNPHISSQKSGLEKTSSPLQEENCVAAPSQVTHYRFFFASEEPQEYENFLKCKHVFKEDFNSFSDGPVAQVSNHGREDVSYVLTHRAEVKHDSPKAENLDQIFGTSTYNFLIQNPVTNNSATGVDRGANSGSESETTPDALVWTFSSPVSFWSAKTVGLEGHSVLRIYNCAEEMLKEVSISGNPTFAGVISGKDEICSVSLTSASGTDAVAVDGFEYGH